MTIHFTSDLHLGHTRIVELSHRPYGSIKEHDDALCANWEKVVRADDIVWVLGDISVEGSFKHALSLLSDLPGRKRLVTGNHDRAWVGKSDWMRFIGFFTEVFEVVTPWARASLMGTKVVLSHFPYFGDHTEGSRFDEYRLQPGKPILHGHTHSTEKLTLAGNIPQLHVGVDAWDYTPVKDTELAALLSQHLSRG